MAHLCVYCFIVVAVQLLSLYNNSLQAHRLQHSWLPCPILSPWVFSGLSPMSFWCYLTISPCAIPFSSCPQSFPVSGSFPMNPLFASDGQSIGASASVSVLPMNIQGWLVWSPCSLVDSQGSSSAPQFESISSSMFCLLYGPTLTSIHDYWENHTLSMWSFVGKVMSLLCNTLSRSVIAFLPRSKCLLIS